MPGTRSAAIAIAGERLAAARKEDAARPVSGSRGIAEVRPSVDDRKAAPGGGRGRSTESTRRCLAGRGSEERAARPRLLRGNPRLREDGAAAWTDDLGAIIMAELHGEHVLAGRSGTLA